jgi:hypothetical protein
MKTVNMVTRKLGKQGQLVSKLGLGGVCVLSFNSP